MPDRGLPPSQYPPLRALLGDVLLSVTTLLRKEIDLARSEMRQALGRAALGAGLVGVAAILATVSLTLLAGAAVLGLVSAGFGAIGAAALVGGAGLLLALVVGVCGAARLRSETLTPTRATRELRRTADVAADAARAGAGTDGRADARAAIDA